MLGNKFKRRFGRLSEWGRKNRKIEDSEKRHTDNYKAIQEYVCRLCGQPDCFSVPREEDRPCDDS